MKHHPRPTRAAVLEFVETNPGVDGLDVLAEFGWLRFRQTKMALEWLILTEKIRRDLEPGMLGPVIRYWPVLSLPS